MLSEEFVSELESIGEKDCLRLWKILNEIQKSDNINFQDNNGNTALIIASCYGYEKIVELFLKYGADINIQNSYKNTALISASKNGYEKIVELLLRSEANVNIQNNDGNTALILASWNGYEKVVELLLKYGADVNIQNDGEVSALMCGYENIENMLRNASQIRENVVLEQEDESKKRLEEHKRIMKRVFR